jgi:hypothetical protein
MATGAELPNLHDREQHGGRTLRWTGPSRETVFYFPIDLARRAGVALRLHLATPAPHAAGSRLFVNGQEVPLRCEHSAAGFALTGQFDPGQPPEECGALSEFKLVSPTQRGASEFRELGVALQRIHVHLQSATKSSLGSDFKRGALVASTR